jgi:hypothetical protein
VAAVTGLEFPLGAASFKEVVTRYGWGIASARFRKLVEATS